MIRFSSALVKLKTFLRQVQEIKCHSGPEGKEKSSIRITKPKNAEFSSESLKHYYRSLWRAPRL